MPYKGPQHPNELLDAVLAKCNLRNDAALARKLDLAPPVISKIRHMKLKISPGILLKLYDASGLSIETLRALLYQTDRTE